MSAPQFYICADTVAEAVRYAHTHRLPLDAWCFYNDPRKLMSARNKFVVFLDSAWRRPDYGVLYLTAVDESRCMDIVDARTGEVTISNHNPLRA